MVAGYNGDRPLKTGPFDYAQGSCDNGDRPLKTGPFDYAQGSYVSAAQGSYVSAAQDSCDNGDRPLHFNLQKSFCIL